MEYLLLILVHAVENYSLCHSFSKTMIYYILNFSLLLCVLFADMNRYLKKKAK